MNNTAPDPITAQERVLVRSTATGFEQTIAAMAGFFTAGPLGAIASWGAIRGLQGKWAPWFVLGVPSAIAINIVQLVVVATLMGVTVEDDQQPRDALNNQIQPEYIIEA